MASDKPERSSALRHLDSRRDNAERERFNLQYKADQWALVREEFQKAIWTIEQFEEQEAKLAAPSPEPQP